MQLTVPFDLIEAQSNVANLDEALLPILRHLDPAKEQDLGGEAGAYFSGISWDGMSKDERAYTLHRFAEFVCNVYRDA